MLIGRIDQLLKDFDKLPENSNNVAVSFTSSIPYEINLLNEIQFMDFDDKEFKEPENFSGFIGFNDDDINNSFDNSLNNNLEKQCDFYTGFDNFVYDKFPDELNDKLVSYVLNNIKRESDGRIRVPILWNDQLSICWHLIKVFILLF